MDERRLRIRVGIVVFAAVIVSMILVVLFGLKPQFLQPQYVVKVGFPRAPGVSRDTPVRKDGVPIGRVSDVMLRDKGGVVITMRIDENRKLRMNEFARISMGSLVTGDAVIEFVCDETDPDVQLLASIDQPLSVLQTLLSEQAVPLVVAMFLCLLILIAFWGRMEVRRFLRYRLSVPGALMLSAVGGALCVLAISSSTDPAHFALSPADAEISTDPTINDLAMNSAYKLLYSIVRGSPKQVIIVPEGEIQALP